MLAGWGVRTRVLAVALLVLLVTLSLWTWLLYELFVGSLQEAAGRQGSMLAGQVAATLKVVEPERAVPDRTPEADTDVMIQVVAAGGEVVSASRADIRAVPLSGLRPGPGSTVTRTVAQLPGVDEEDFVVTARGATGCGGEAFTVVVASPVHVEANDVARGLLPGLVTGVAVLAIAAVLVRWAVSASLRPVERLRGQLAGIDGHSIGDRVDVPETGDELSRLGETMNQMLARLEGAYATQRAFVSDAGHELRSPLATIRASVELASADPTGEMWQEGRGLLLAEILRLQLLVDDLLTLSRYDAGSLPLRTTDCDLDDLAVQAGRRTQAESGLPVALDVEPVRVVADPDRVGQVLRNLLDNAARHARAEIRLGVHHVGDHAVLWVDNDGAPVPEPDRERVFERFVRLDDTRDRDSGGSGLGLAIAADLARAHGGSLSSGIAPDGWCRFELRLPESGPGPAGSPRPAPSPGS
ncbi:MAG: HAMP domain-containing sensor histidine kinase [Nocardioides sp.]